MTRDEPRRRFLTVLRRRVEAVERARSERMLREAAEKAHPGDPGRQRVYLRGLIDTIWTRQLAGREIAMGVAWGRADVEH